MAATPPDDSLILSDCYLHTALADNIKSLYLARLLFDVTFKTKEGTLRAHKLVLSASSKYFRALFTSDLKTEETTVDLTLFDGSALEAVVNYFYTGEIVLNERNLVSVMEVEDMLCVGGLRPLVSEAAARLLRPANSWALWSHCRALGYHDVADQAFLRARENFASLVQDSAFLDVPYSLLEECLDSPHLAVPQEDLLLKRLCCWAVHDVEAREKYVEALLGKVEAARLSEPKATLDYVLDLFSAVGRLDLVADWVDLSLRTNKEHIPSEDNRYFELMTKVVFVIGGECGRVLQTVECLPAVQSPWRPTLPTHQGDYGSLHSRHSAPPVASLLEPRYAAAASSSSTHVFVLGGAKGLDETEELATVERYSIYKNCWSSLPELPSPKLYAASAYTNGSLYLSGGLSADCVSAQLLVLGANSKSWRQLAPMLYERCEHNLVAVNGILYAVGGFDKCFKALSSVEKYDPMSDSWTEVAPMQSARMRGGAVASQRYIYVFGGTAYVRETEDYRPDKESYYERFDTLKNKWSVCGVCPNSSWNRVRSVSVDKAVVSTTGSVGVSVYYPASGQSSPGPCLLEPRRDHALVSLLLPLHARPPI